MNTLIITAHPASYGFTHKIAERYKQVEEGTGNSVEIMDLYAHKYAQPFLSFENLKTDTGPTPTKTLIQEKIAWADELVFVAPVWNMSVPAIMKNFFDVNFSAGFAFKYGPNGLEKLLTGKRARFYLTADGPKWLYLFYNRVLKYLTLGGFLHSYCGMKIESIMTFTEMFKKRTDEERDAMLEKVSEHAMKK